MSSGLNLSRCALVSASAWAMPLRAPRPTNAIAVMVADAFRKLRRWKRLGGWLASRFAHSIHMRDLLSDHGTDSGITQIELFGLGQMGSPSAKDFVELPVGRGINTRGRNVGRDGRHPLPEGFIAGFEVLVEVGRKKNPTALNILEAAEQCYTALRHLVQVDSLAALVAGDPR